VFESLLVDRVLTKAFRLLQLSLQTDDAKVLRNRSLPLLSQFILHSYIICVFVKASLSNCIYSYYYFSKVKLKVGQWA
jgi:hypothetical protein